MKKVLPNIIGVILGLCFLAASVPFFLKMTPNPQFPEGSPIAHFMAAFVPTGYMMFVKVCEFVGAILVMIPRFRHIGLLVLGPVIVNIIASTVFVMNGQGFGNPLLIVVIASALFLLWSARAKFSALLN